MTRQEFLNKVRETRNQFTWKVIDNKIRGFTDVKDTFYEACLITSLHPDKPPAYHVWNVYKEVGLSSDDARAIVASSDNTTVFSANGLHTDPDPELRQQLLEAVGLAVG